MSDLKAVFDPPEQPVSVDELWERGLRARRRRQAIPRVAAAVVAVVLVGVALLATAGSDRSSEVVAGPTDNPTVDDSSQPSLDGEVTRTYPIPETLRELTVSGGLSVKVVAGPGPVSIIGPSAVLDSEVTVTVDAGGLRVERDQDMSGRSRDDVHVTVPVASLNLVDAADGVQLIFATTLTTRQLELVLSGGVNLTGTVDVQTLIVDATDGVNARLDGAATTTRLTATDGVNLELASLTSATVQVALSSGTLTAVRATDRIEGTLTDGSVLTHHGSAAVTVDADQTSVLQPR